jgi:hypothetical protein
MPGLARWTGDKPVWPAGFPLNKMSLWQKAGQDRHSQVADPLSKDVEASDFTLGTASPALALGFRPVDTSDVGPRSKGRRD